MPITITVESAQANLYQLLNQLDAGDLDKVVVQDEGANLFQIVTRAVYEAADPGGSAGAEVDVVTAYSQSPSVYSRSLYKMIKNMRDRQAGPDAQTAKGAITAVPGAQLIDTETFTLINAANVTFVFEFDSAAGVTPPNIPVPFTGVDADTVVAASIQAAINGSASGVIAAAPVGALVNLTQSDPGTAGNNLITETVANAGFLVTGFSGGTDAGVEAGVIALKNSKNDPEARAFMVPEDHAVAIGL